MDKKHFLMSMICFITISLSMFAVAACSIDNHPPHTHVYDKQVVNDTFKASDATCEEKAEYYYSCLCGAKGTEKFKKGSALGHAYGDWVSIGNGQHKKLCANDNSHTITENCSGGTATCIEKAKCLVCATEYGEAKGHAYSPIVTEPTCTEQGYITYTCHCNHSYKDNYVEALGHTEVVDNAINATFSSSGLTAGSHCSVCNEVIIAQVQIPALGFGGDSQQGVVASPEYSDVEEGVSYRYSYSLNIKDNDSFILTTLTIGSDETYSLNYSSGKISNIGNEIHELIFDDGRDSMYIRFIDNKFEFCKRDGLKWDKEKYERPEDVTTIDLVPRLGNTTYGYYDLANNVHGESMQELYRRMFYACEAFVNNTDDIQSTNGFYILDAIDLSHYIINVNEVISTWKVFIVENPRYYWLSNSLTVDGSNLKFCIDEAYSKADYRAQCDAAIDGMIEDCNAFINDGMSKLEIALTIHDFIINRMNYAYEDDGITPQDDIWAHNMVGCAKYNLGVCESFAETFMFLCRLNDVDTIIVTGTANKESHAWNIVKIDGVWYGVDVTWDETNEEGLISYNCFGMSREYCNSTHNADSFDKLGVNYLYQIPEMCENSIELVDLLKNDEYVGTYVSIDKAFEYMTDQNADYTLQLYSYTLQGPLLISSPSIIHNIYSTETPNVKSITIKGNFEKLGNGYSTCTSVFINNYLTLLSNTLILYDIGPVGKGTLCIHDNCVKIVGEFCYVRIPIIGSVEDGAESKIVCSTSRNTEFYKEVKVYEMYAPENVVMFRGRSVIVNLKAKIISVYGGNVDIEKLHGIFEYCTVELSNMGSANIQHLYSDSNRISINIRFGKIEEFPMLTLGVMESYVNITLDGVVHYSITDVYGNEIGNYTEEANPLNVTKPIAHVSQNSDFEKVKISFENKGEKTSLYFVNSSGDIVLKPYENKDGLIIMDGIVVHYSGTDTTINIPEGVTSIASSVFRNYHSLKSVVIPNSLINIGEYAFAGTSLTSVIILGNLTSIELCAFSGCNSLTSILIPESVTNIGKFAFNGCSKLIIYCEATSQSSDWDVAWNYDDCPVYWHSETEPTSLGNYWHYVDGVPTSWTNTEE